MNVWGTRLVSLLGTVAVVALFPLTMRADGMVIPLTGYAIPQIPDQRALICYAGETETLIIETSFVAEGTNFAWIVPLPAVAQIEPVSTGLFPTLQTIFQPKVVSSVGHYWLALPIAALLIWLANVALRSVYHGLLVALFLLLVAALLLPALGPARTRGGAEPASTFSEVAVLARQNAGLFETATIQSADPSALLRWLNEHGYSVPTNITPVVADYVREGWVFAAAKLRSEAGGTSSQATHPLAFTFKTSKPVYPLRLTGTGSDSCRVDLYVFGPARAEVPGFTVKRCEAPDYDAVQRWARLWAGKLQIRHTELGQLVARAPVATKLTALLTPSAMARDAYVEWWRYRPCGGEVYTIAAARTLSGNVSALLFMALAAVWWLLSNFKTRDSLHTERWGKWLAPASLVVGLWVYFLALPTIDRWSLKMTRLSFSGVYSDQISLALALEDIMQDTNLVAVLHSAPSGLNPPQSTRLLAELYRYFDSWPPPRGVTRPGVNCFTGKRIRFEASPGNSIVRPANSLIRRSGGSVVSGYELIWHDLDGAEALTNTVPVGWLMDNDNASP